MTIQKRTQFLIDRLFNEWKEHGKIIIALDFDDTISPWKIDNPDWFDEVRQVVKACQDTGAFVMIHSACAPSRYEYIKAYCQDRGIKIDSFNENPIPLPYGNVTKPYANIYLDDRAGLDQALEILNAALYKYRVYKKEQTQSYPGAL